MAKLCLLDAYALIYRAYYALIRSPRINSKGENTSAIFGFVNTLDDVLRSEKPDYIGIAFDPAGPTFRHEMYPDYKAQREATPEDIRNAVPVIKDIVRAYRIPILEVAGYEADDVIGTVAKRAAAAGMDVRMITPDKDYAQLVEPAVRMCRPGHGAAGMEVLGPEEVCAKYGLVEPKQVIDYLGLTGDAADNIPGCPGVGDKTATKLLQQFGSIEGLLARTDELKGALRKKVEENADQIRFSKQLVTICTDVPMDVDFETLKIETPDEDALRALYEKLEFRSFLSKLDRKAPPQQLDLFATETILPPAEPSDSPTDENKTTLADIHTTPHRYFLVEDEEEIKRLGETLLTKQSVCLDTETTSVEAIHAELVGLSFAFVEGEAYYVPVPRENSAALKILSHFRPFYENASIEKIGQNLKYDLTVLARYGICLRGRLFDTMLAHYLVQPELRHNMDYLAEIYLRYRTIHIDALIGPKGKGQKNMADLPPSAVYEYACEDADITLRLVPKLRAELAKYDVQQVFDDIEMPLMPVLARMEMNGVRLDVEALAETGEQFRRRMQQLESEIFDLAGHEFLLTSPRQVGEVLFDELRLNEKAKKTKTGQYTTSEEVLESLRTKHPIVGKILAHRALKKLLSTYVEALPRLVNPTTDRIHTSYNQAVTATGRLSSSNPNLQNIPVRGDDGREIRKAFVPEEGSLFFSADYSQIELRIMAHLSGDANMIEAFRAGHDIHAATAARIFKKPIEAITKDERRKAKTANFGIIYGISAFGLAERMEVSRTEAKELIDNYFATFPRVREYMDESIARARERGFIATEFGRRRYLADINSRNAVVRGYAERNAINAPIQGTAADIIKIAMVRIDRRLREEGLRAKMILQVHDELNFSVPADELDRLRALVIEEMEAAYTMQVPLVADCGVGTNWLEAH